MVFLEHYLFTTEKVRMYWQEYSEFAIRSKVKQGDPILQLCPTPLMIRRRGRQLLNITGTYWIQQ